MKEAPSPAGGGPAAHGELGYFFFAASFGEKGFAGMCAKASNAVCGLAGTAPAVAATTPAPRARRTWVLPRRRLLSSKRSQAMEAWILAVVDTAPDEGSSTGHKAAARPRHDDPFNLCRLTMRAK